MDPHQPFGRFWLHEQVGSGGWAEIFRASVGPEAELYAFDFAVKRLLARHLADERARARFQVEAYLASLIVHPNVVRVFEVGEADGQPYIAMEYVPGVSLATLLRTLYERRMAVPPPLAIWITLRLLQALDCVHRARAVGGRPLEVIHRDVNPANILLSFSGEVKLTDFGVARAAVLEPQDEQALLKGKAAYMPPDVLGGGPVTQESDVWAASLCLFEMVAGHRAFEGLTEDEIVARAGTLRVATLRDDPQAPVEPVLAQLLASLLSHRPAKRPATAAAAYRALKAYAQERGFDVEQDDVARFVLATCGDLESFAARDRVAGLDPVTNAPAYRRFLELLQVEFERSRRYGRVFSVVCLSLDGFRSTNEEAGAAAGDAVLRLVCTDVLPRGAALRSSDWVARKSGDVFFVVLPETPRPGAAIVAERIRSAFERTDWRGVDPRRSRPITASVGVASYPEHGATVGAIVECAVVAQARAKRQGKNAVVVATSEFAEIKARIGDGTATGQDLERWRQLKEAHRDAQEPPLVDDRQVPRARIPLELRFKALEEFVSSFVTDIGTGGLRVQVPVDLEVGAELTLLLCLPTEATPVTVKARVAWQRKDRVTGLQFVDLEDDVRERIEALLDVGAGVVVEE